MTYNNPKNFHQCTNLSEWLLVKYGLSYTVFKAKPKIIQNSFIQEFESDTGRIFNEFNETTPRQIWNFLMKTIFHLEMFSKFIINSKTPEQNQESFLYKMT